MTITNLLMEQTRTNAGAFIDESKLIVDGGFRTAANNVASSHGRRKIGQNR